MKTIVLNKKFYVRSTEDGSVGVWKNNGDSAPDTLVKKFGSLNEALAEADKLEAKARAVQPDNRSMNDINAILACYLADNPEITKNLLDRAVKHVAAKKRRSEAKRKVVEATIAVDNATREINSLQAEINRLRGKVLSLQKARKALLGQAIAATQELNALDAR